MITLVIGVQVPHLQSSVTPEFSASLFLLRGDATVLHLLLFFEGP